MFDVHLGRRDFLRVGAAGALTLPWLLQNQARAGSHGKAKSVLLVFLGGGLSHHDSFDLKPEAPQEIRGPYRQIDSNVVGLKVGEKLPRMAKCMDRVALVRSGSHH